MLPNIRVLKEILRMLCILPAAFSICDEDSSPLWSMSYIRLCFEGARLGAILVLPRDRLSTSGRTKGRQLPKWSSLSLLFGPSTLPARMRLGHRSQPKKKTSIEAPSP